MSTTAVKLEVERIVLIDTRNIAFYITLAGDRRMVLTGSVLSCRFTSADELTVEDVSIILYEGDGRAHVPVAAPKVATVQKWKLLITGTNGAGETIPPIEGSMDVVAPD